MLLGSHLHPLEGSVWFKCLGGKLQWQRVDSGLKTRKHLKI